MNESVFQSWKKYFLVTTEGLKFNLSEDGNPAWLLLSKEGGINIFDVHTKT